MMRALITAWTTAAVGALFLLLCTGASCGGVGASDPVRTHAQIAGALHEPISQAKFMIEARAANQVRDIQLRAATPEDAAAQVAALQKSYAPLEAAMNAVIAAHSAYVDAVTSAHRNDTQVSHELAQALLAQWKALLRVAAALGLELPQIPEFFAKEVQRGQ